MSEQGILTLEKTGHTQVSIFLEGWISETASESSPNGFIQSYMTRYQNCVWLIMVPEKNYHRYADKEQRT